MESTSGDEHGGDRDDQSAWQLDDDLDRDELRDRYYGLIQELRVLLPGVQILVAFLLTVPFFDRWESLGSWERDWYVVALTAGMASVVVFATPTALHRVGDRRARAARLGWSIRLTRAALALLGAAMTASLVLVISVLFSHAAGVIAGAIAAAVMLAAWLWLPRLLRGPD